MTMALFLCTVAWVVGWYVWLFHRHGGVSLGKCAAVAVAWLAATGLPAWLGFWRFGEGPPWIVLALVGATVASTWLGRSDLVQGAPLWALVGFHAFRIPVELFLWQGWQAGFVPMQMTWHGRNWDVLTGILATMLAVARCRPGPWVRVWNLLGMGLLWNVAGVALLSTPTPLRLFPNEPANRFIAEWPYIWLPAVIVPGAWLGHLLVYASLGHSAPKRFTRWKR